MKTCISLFSLLIQTPIKNADKFWFVSTVSYNMITKIESYLLVDKEEYSILSLQIGPSSSTRYWLYFIPSQLVSDIKLRIFGEPF